VKHLVIGDIAKADLKSIRRFSLRAWGPERTSEYMSVLRDTMKGLARQTVVNRERDDLRPGLRMAASGRHCVFFEADETRVLVVRVLHDRMDYQRHLWGSLHPTPRTEVG
jgi:toxin ParE1/3/4